MLVVDDGMIPLNARRIESGHLIDDFDDILGCLRNGY